eukprot:11437733-Alexandrium_andersonii.AAC.1
MPGPQPAKTRNSKHTAILQAVLQQATASSNVLRVRIRGLPHPLDSPPAHASGAQCGGGVCGGG